MGKYIHKFDSVSDFNAQYNGDTKIPIAVTADGSYKYGGISQDEFHNHMWLPLDENGEWDDNSETLYSSNFVINLNGTGQLWSIDGYVSKTVTAINYIDNPNTYIKPWLSYTTGRGIDYNKNDPRIYDGGNVLDLRGIKDNPNIYVDNYSSANSEYMTPPDAYQYYALKASVYETFDGCNGYPVITTLLIDDVDKPSGENTATFTSNSGDECYYQANGTPWVIYLGPHYEIGTNYTGD